MLFRSGDETSDLDRAMAAVFGAISAITGGGVVAISVLRIADRFAGHPGSPPAPPSIPPPPPPGGMSVTPGSLSATGVATTSTTTARPTPAAMTGDFPGGVAGGTGYVAGNTVSNPDTLRGGAWIGALERLAVVATLLARWPEGLAVILAVKGLGRYPELRRPAAAERFIIGTLASALWSIACVGVIVALTGDPAAG